MVHSESIRHFAYCRMLVFMTLNSPNGTTALLLFSSQTALMPATAYLALCHRTETSSSHVTSLNYEKGEEEGGEMRRDETR